VPGRAASRPAWCAVPTLVDISNSDGNGTTWSTGRRGRATVTRSGGDNADFFLSTESIRCRYPVPGVRAGDRTVYYRCGPPAPGEQRVSSSKTAGVIPPAPQLLAIDNPEKDGEYLVDWGDVPAPRVHAPGGRHSAFDSPTVRYNAPTPSSSHYPGAGRLYYRAMGECGVTALVEHQSRACRAAAVPRCHRKRGRNGTISRLDDVAGDRIHCRGRRQLYVRHAHVIYTGRPASTI